MQYLRVAFLLLLGAFPTSNDAQTSNLDLDLANSLASSYNSWVALRQHAIPGTFNVLEYRTWRETKQAWKRLEKFVDNNLYENH